MGPETQHPIFRVTCLLRESEKTIMSTTTLLVIVLLVLLLGGGWGYSRRG